MKLSAASAFLVSAGPLVDLGRILAVITDRITDLPNRETGPLRRRLDSLVTVETGGAQVQPSGELARSDVGHCNAMYDTDQRGYPARRCLWLLQTRHSPTSQC